MVGKNQFVASPCLFVARGLPDALRLKSLAGPVDIRLDHATRDAADDDIGSVVVLAQSRGCGYDGIFGHTHTLQAGDFRADPHMILNDDILRLIDAIALQI